MLLIRFFPSLVLFVLMLGLSSIGAAQDLFIKGELGDAASQNQTEDPATFSANFKVKPDSREGVLSVQAKIEPDWHIYSITQPKGGPMRSKIKVAESKEFKVSGEFKPNKKPHIAEVEGFDVHAEEHSKSVIWSAPIEFAEGVDVEKAVIQITFNGQVCESKPPGSCKPLFGIKMEGKFAGYEKGEASSAAEVKIKMQPFTPGSTHAVLTGRIFHPEGKPIQAGDTVKLELSAKPKGNYHVYAYEKGKCDYMATRIGFTETSNCKIDGPKASTKPHLDDSLGIDMKYHHGPVKWTFDVTVPSDSELKSVVINGVIGLQTCDDEQCDPPAGATFAAEVAIGSVPGTGLKFDPKTYGTAKKAQAAYLDSLEK